MLKIAVDCMGNDNGSEVIVAAINEFLNEKKDVMIYACGDEKELETLKSNPRVNFPYYRSCTNGMWSFTSYENERFFYDESFFFI